MKDSLQIPESYEYEKNEKVLCYHGPLIYEAKILEREFWTDGSESTTDTLGAHYLVHYQGWNSKWDDWVPQSRVLKYDEKGLAKQKEIKEMQTRAKQAASASKAGADASTQASAGPSSKANGMASAAKGKKRTRETAFDTEQEYMKRPEVKIVIPDLLKVKLVDDWEQVTKNNNLVTLPRSPTVQEIVNQYKADVLKDKGRETREDALTAEVLSGLIVYFNKALGNNLLYRFERAQYKKIRESYRSESQEEKPMSEVYGAEHLLRLFVNLPQFIAHTSMDTQSINILRDEITRFLAWMQKESKRLFQYPYEATTSTYQAQSRT